MCEYLFTGRKMAYSWDDFIHRVFTSMASLVDLNKKIAKLQKLADAIRERERKSVIEQIRRDIHDYELTVADLFSPNGGPAGRRGRRPGVAAQRQPAGEGGSPRRGRPAGSGTRKPVPIRYRDDEGNTWTGRGKQPNWLKAHVENGRDINEFLVNQNV